ncbi:MAG: DeoR family transcriptional regulator [Candidatus Peregrinibacteria bacterium]|nr:DeoR family transcriptional regulator [Candidatus Peregrinibacteria bacterium]
MLPIDPRKQQVLSAIIQHFINTAEPVGSNTVLVNYKIEVSPATIRNDMAFLENEGFITQPHTSAGRIPTVKGYKMYIDQLADYKKAEKLAKANIKKLREGMQRRKAQQQVYEAVTMLSHAIPNVSFGSIPDNKRTFYLGVSNMLKQPEFLEYPLHASQVMEVLEEGTHFLKTLDQLDIEYEPRIFIGKENILPQIESCSLIVSRYKFEDYEGYLGLLGPIRMPYAYNLAILKEVIKMLSK